jgi:hypothetical protein
MGREAKIEFTSGAERTQVRAHLDSQTLELTGGKKLKLPLASVTAAVVKGGVLTVVAGKTKFSLALGVKEAEAWQRKILNPPSLADKLGFKPDKTVALAGVMPAEILKAATVVLRATAVKSLGPKTPAADIAVIMLAPGNERPLIEAAARALGAGQADAAWLVYEKGRPVNGDGIIALARASGLKDTKVARVSDKHAALRFIPASGR